MCNISINNTENKDVINSIGKVKTSIKQIYSGYVLGYSIEYNILKCQILTQKLPQPFIKSV